MGIKDKLKKAYERIDKAVGGKLPGGVPSTKEEKIIVSEQKPSPSVQKGTTGITVTDFPTGES